MAIRAALPTPVEGGNGEPALPQIDDGLKVFLDRFGTTLKNADRAERSSSDSAPAGIAKSDTVGCCNAANDSAVGDRIGVEAV